MLKSGIIIVLKPTGLSSSDVVSRMRKILGTRQVGHLGTLDPAGTGVLPISYGTATKLFDYYLKKDKVYRAMFKFSVETNTLDSDGEVIHRDDKIITKNDILSILPQFIGKIKQVPPKVSAVHINGRRAYDLERNHVEFNIPFKEVEIFDIKVADTDTINLFQFDIHCSAGTYIRSLARDIAVGLNTFATMVSIIRMKSGSFLIEDAHATEEIAQNPEKYTISIENALSSEKNIEINNEDYYRFKTGQEIFLNKEYDQVNIEFVAILFNNKVIALAEINNGKLIIKSRFNNEDK
ncbi:MAG: tRNA pseudouridine(55) synthase TruB [Clostridia bacterium]